MKSFREDIKNTYFSKRFLLGLSIFSISSLIGYLFLYSDISWAQGSIPTLSLDLAQSEDPEDVMPALKIVAILTILTIAPAIMLMMTSFTRILIVLSFIRQALGTQTMPPNQVIVGLALFLTLFTMKPVWDQIDKTALTPYMEKTITQDVALENLIVPVKKFMLTETRKDDLALFLNITKQEKPKTEDEISMTVLVPSFMVSELKTAFQMGFMVYIPFLIIDMVVSAILMAMGMMMLPPTVVSLPFKLVLFVLVDGWSLIVESIVKSFASFV